MTGTELYQIKRWMLAMPADVFVCQDIMDIVNDGIKQDILTIEIEDINNVINSDSKILGDYVKSDRKVSVIKLLRHIFVGWGIREAKDYVDEHWQEWLLKLNKGE